MFICHIYLNIINVVIVLYYFVDSYIIWRNSSYEYIWRQKVVPVVEWSEVLYASCSRWIINGTAGKLHIIYMHINDDWNMQFQLWLTVTWVYTSRPAPSVALYYRLLTASAHRCIVVECIVRAYFVLIYYLLVTCFISILTNNAIVLYYFVDSYKQLLLLHIMGIPAMMVMVPGGATSC